MSGHIDIPFKIKDRKSLPKGLEASVRWDPIDVSTATGDSAGAPDASGTTTPPASTPLTRPSALGDPTGPGPGGGAATSPDDLPHIAVPPDASDLLVAEQFGDVVAPAGVKLSKTALSVPVTFPTTPGRYRLSISLFDGDGVAYDAATQAMIPSLVVRVTGDFDGSIQAASTAQVTAGADVALDVRVVNLGRVAWGHSTVASTASLGQAAHTQAADVVGRWIPLSVDAALPADLTAQTASADLPIGLAPGASANATLSLTAPTAAGEYVFLLDVVTPERGSLVASGAEPTVVRVTVQPATTP
jgi:hypothetical protein